MRTHAVNESKPEIVCAAITAVYSTTPNQKVNLKIQRKATKVLTPLLYLFSRNSGIVRILNLLNIGITNNPEITIAIFPVQVCHIIGIPSL